MELLVSAASPRQLVIGKALGIGLAGATQYVLVLVPAILTLARRGADRDRAPRARRRGSRRRSRRCRRRSSSRSPRSTCSGSRCTALIYAAAGSLVSRPEDLQIIALPLSLLAIVGYIQAILALTGGITGFIRFASLRPVLEPVRDADPAVGRAGRADGARRLDRAADRDDRRSSAVVAIRIYSAGVLLYGQRPGLRAYVAAARHGCGSRRGARRPRSRRAGPYPIDRPSSAGRLSDDPIPANRIARSSRGRSPSRSRGRRPMPRAASVVAPSAYSSNSSGSRLIRATTGAAAVGASVLAGPASPGRPAPRPRRQAPTGMNRHSRDVTPGR